MKMPFYITVNDGVYSLCIKALKKSLTRLKVTATITWFEKKGVGKQDRQVLQPAVRKRHTPNLLNLFVLRRKTIRYQCFLFGFPYFYFAKSVVHFV